MVSHPYLPPQSRFPALTIRRLFIAVGSYAAPTPDRPGPPDPAALLDLPTIADGDLGRRLPAARTDRFNLLDHVVARHDLSEHDVLAVEVRRRGGAEEELGSVRVRPGVRHRQGTGPEEIGRASCREGWEV